MLTKISSPLGKGVSVSLNGIKTDIIDWNTKFNFPVIEIKNIRFAAKEDIIGMKLDSFLCQPEYARFDKKDFIDLAFLLNEFTLENMIAFYRKRNTDVLSPERMILEGLQWHQFADKKPGPKMMIELSWAEVTKKIDDAVENYINKRLN
jgi:hypothetical protein